MKSEMRKQAILDATETVLVDIGGAAMTMRKVSDQAGISLGNLQYHYPKRDDLLIALLHRFLSRYETELQTITVYPESDLQADLTALFLRILCNPDVERSSIIFKELWAAANQDAALHQMLTAYYRRLAGFYQQGLTKLTQGRVAKEEITGAVALLLPMIEGHCVTKSAQTLPAADLARIWAGVISIALSLDG